MKTENLIYILLGIVASLGTTLAIEQDVLLEELTEVLQNDLKSKAGKLIKNKKFGPRTLACPRAPRRGPIPERTEPVCQRHKQCGEGERCCDWSDAKHCLKAISKKQRLGRCPQITQVNDMCFADGPSCRFDNECPGEDEKCCLNPGCGYKECLSIRQNLACPRPNVPHPVHRAGAACSKDTECSLDEKCCNWSGESKQCLKGISTIPKPGPCILPSRDSAPTCFADSPTCEYDSECPGVNEKCCYNSQCGHTECSDMNKFFVCPNLELPTQPEKVSKCSGQNDTCEGFGQVCCATAKKASGDLIFECTEGEYHEPKQGTCPPSAQLAVPGEECMADEESACEYDDDCFGRHKCCETACGSKDCVRVGRRNSNNNNDSSNNRNSEGNQEVLSRLLTLLEKEEE
ncbi:uncharacterized protein [Watersipora subatra]|uniref:uncharacterized protein n=1 Tax=Watersipora subatra TaxID=2589382 RepID=UPI00355AD04C